MSQEEKPCRLCNTHDFSEDAMRALLDEYIESLPEDALTDQRTYEARLSLCYACTRQIKGTCGLCGCYVRTRAARHQMHCPDSPAKW